jgi:putative membrane protein
MGVFSTAYVAIVVDLAQLHYESTIQFHSIIGVMLGLFLVFRINTAYDRWWEGRKLWGKLVNDTRHLAIKINSMLPIDRTVDREFFIDMIANIAFATKEHLRDSILVSELSLPDETLRNNVISSTHRPNKLADALFERTNQLYKDQIIDGYQLYILDKELKGFVDMIGGCERIKTTPIPFSFSMFIKKFLFIYSLTLPVSFAWQFGYWTTPIVILTFYFLVSVELISEEIEDPFGEDINDLPLDEICFKIKKNVEEIMLKN